MRFLKSLFLITIVCVLCLDRLGAQDAQGQSSSGSKVEKSFADIQRLVISNFENTIASEWSKEEAGEGAPFESERNTDKVKEGSASARWEPIKRPWVFLKKCPEDWSKYQVLRFWLYASEANGQQINFWFHSDEKALATQSAGKPRAYYFSKIKVDWTGWRQVTIDLSKCSPVRNPLGWNKICSMMISAKGADAVPMSGVLWFDEMELVGL